MPFRLQLVSLVASLVTLCAGCGGPPDGSADRAGHVPTARSAGQSDLQPLRQGNASPASSRHADDAEARGAPPVPAEQADAPGDEGDARVRTWTDTDGATLAVAELVTVLDGDVCLQTQDGVGVRFPLEKLSAADQRYVKTLSRDTAGETVPEESRRDVADVAAASDPDVLVERTSSRPDPTPGRSAPSRRQKVVIPFDFVSDFDQGRYGQMVGDMIWDKLQHAGGFVIPESMLDVRDFCASKHYKITPHTPLEEVAEIVRTGFDADIAIWGRVERAPGHEWDVYELVIKCVDFSGPEPRVIYETEGVRTQVVSEIGHLYVQQMLDKLYDRKPGGPPPVDPVAEENWKKNPNLVEGGDFQRGAGGVPVGWAPGWEAGYVNQYERLGNHVQWAAEPGNPSNRLIRFTLDKALGDTTGVAYYNARPFPIQEGAKYRFQCRWRTNGPKVIVFIKCYDQMGTEYAEAAKRTPSQVGSGLRRESYVPESSQLRECYRSQQNLYGDKNTWNLHTQDFTPTHTRYHPRWGKVMLYAYLGGGVVEFDDVVLKQILPPSSGAGKEEPRHSLESTVTIRQMEENELRGAEARQRLRKRKEKEAKEPR